MADAENVEDRKGDSQSETEKQSEESKTSDQVEKDELSKVEETLPAQMTLTVNETTGEKDSDKADDTVTKVEETLPADMTLTVKEDKDSDETGGLDRASLLAELSAAMPSDDKPKETKASDTPSSDSAEKANLLAEQNSGKKDSDKADDTVTKVEETLPADMTLTVKEGKDSDETGGLDRASLLAELSDAMPSDDKPKETKASNKPSEDPAEKADLLASLAEAMPSTDEPTKINNGDSSSVKISTPASALKTEDTTKETPVPEVQPIIADQQVTKDDKIDITQQSAKHDQDKSIDLPADEKNGSTQHNNLDIAVNQVALDTTKVDVENSETANEKKVVNDVDMKEKEMHVAVSNLSPLENFEEECVATLPVLDTPEERPHSHDQLIGGVCNEPSCNRVHYHREWFWSEEDREKKDKQEAAEAIQQAKKKKALPASSKTNKENQENEDYEKPPRPPRPPLPKGGFRPVMTNIYANTGILLGVDGNDYASKTRSLPRGTHEDSPIYEHVAESKMSKYRTGSEQGDSSTPRLRKRNSMMAAFSRLKKRFSKRDHKSPQSIPSHYSNLDPGRSPQYQTLSSKHGPPGPYQPTVSRSQTLPLGRPKPHMQVNGRNSYEAPLPSRPMNPPSRPSAPNIRRSQTLPLNRAAPEPSPAVQEATVLPKPPCVSFPTTTVITVNYPVPPCVSFPTTTGSPARPVAMPPCVSFPTTTGSPALPPQEDEEDDIDFIDGAVQLRVAVKSSSLTRMNPPPRPLSSPRPMTSGLPPISPYGYNKRVSCPPDRPTSPPPALSYSRPGSASLPRTFKPSRPTSPPPVTSSPIMELIKEEDPEVCTKTTTSVTEAAPPSPNNTSSNDNKFSFGIKIPKLKSKLGKKSSNTGAVPATASSSGKKHHHPAISKDDNVDGEEEVLAFNEDSDVCADPRPSRPPPPKDATRSPRDKKSQSANFAHPEVFDPLPANDTDMNDLYPILGRLSKHRSSRDEYSWRVAAASSPDSSSRSATYFPGTIRPQGSSVEDRNAVWDSSDYSLGLRQLMEDSIRNFLTAWRNHVSLEMNRMPHGNYLKDKSGIYSAVPLAGWEGIVVVTNVTTGERFGSLSSDDDSTPNEVLAPRATVVDLLDAYLNCEARMRCTNIFPATNISSLEEDFKGKLSEMSKILLLLNVLLTFQKVSFGLEPGVTIDTSPSGILVLAGSWNQWIVFRKKTQPFNLATTAAGNEYETAQKVLLAELKNLQSGFIADMLECTISIQQAIQKSIGRVFGLLQKESGVPASAHLMPHLFSALQPPDLVGYMITRIYAFKSGID